MTPPVNATPQRPPPAPSPPRNPSGPALRLTPQLLWGAAWALTALLLSAYAFKRLFPGDLTDSDAMDYAQIARNIANGHGFATSILRPLALSGFVTPDPQAGDTATDISRAPLFPLALMLSFVAHGGHGGGSLVVLTSLAFFLASAAAVFFLARTVFPVEGQPWLALLCVGLYVLGGTALDSAAQGLPTSLATLVASLFFIALFRSHEAGQRAVPPVQVLVVGMLLGLCYLVQFSLLILVLTTLVYVFATRAPSRAWAGVGVCLAGFLLVTLPWLVRTAVVTHGNPFFTLLQYGLLSNTAEYPGQSSIYRSVLPQDAPFSFFFAHIGEMARKLGQGLTFYQSHLTTALPLLILAPALASLLWRFSDLRVGILRGYVAGSVSLLAVVTTFFAPSAAFLAPFAPIITVLGVGFVFELMGRQQWRPLSQRVALWGWAALMGLGLFGALIGHVAAPPGTISAGLRMLISPPSSPLYHISATQIHDDIAGGAVITDTPWEVAWRIGLPAVWLPRDNQAYAATVKGTQGVGQAPAPTLLLTPNVAAYGAGDDAMSWVALARDPQPTQSLKQRLARIDQQAADEQARLAFAERRLATPDAQTMKINPKKLNLLKRKIAQAMIELPRQAAAAKADAQTQFTSTFGPISEVVNDYNAIAQRPETNGAPSTLFLRAELTGTAKTPMRATQ